MSGSSGRLAGVCQEVWIPSLLVDATEFHDGDGAELNNMFRDHQLESIDKAAVKNLVDRLTALAPDLVDALKERSLLSS